MYLCTYLYVVRYIYAYTRMLKFAGLIPTLTGGCWTLERLCPNPKPSRQSTNPMTACDCSGEFLSPKCPCSAGPQSVQIVNCEVSLQRRSRQCPCCVPAMSNSGVRAAPNGVVFYLGILWYPLLVRFYPPFGV